MGHTSVTPVHRPSQLSDWSRSLSRVTVLHLSTPSLKPDLPYNTIHASYKPPNEQKQKEYANGVDKSVVSEYNTILPYIITGRCQLFGNMSAMCSTWQHHTQIGLLCESLKFVSLMGDEYKPEFHFAIEPILVDACALVLPTRVFELSGKPCMPVP